MNDTMVPELAGLMNMISDMLNETALIPDIARIVLGYARPCHGDARSLMRYNDNITVRFIANNEFGISLRACLKYSHGGECDYNWSGVMFLCSCSHQHMLMKWGTLIHNSYPSRLDIHDIVKFSDIWRYVATGSDTCWIPDNELTPDAADTKEISNNHGRRCLAPGFREIIRRLMHTIWFGKEKSEERIVYLDQ